MLIAGALLGWGVEPARIDWQPALAASEPWRAFSAAFVHFSPMHLWANVAGALLTIALGMAGRVPTRAALAWLIAWPLTQLGLLAQPALLHYGGLSGVLHAGVAVVATHLLLGGNTRQRRLGGVILAVLVLKVIHEAPWAATLTRPPGWDIAVAPGAHLSGVCSGIAACALVELLSRALRPAQPLIEHARTKP